MYVCKAKIKQAPFIASQTPSAFNCQLFELNVVDQQLL
jgi:hypothetical protein